jgi:hypothetical protein
LRELCRLHIVQDRSSEKKRKKMKHKFPCLALICESATLICESNELRLTSIMGDGLLGIQVKTHDRATWNPRIGGEGGGQREVAEPPH